MGTTHPWRGLPGHLADFSGRLAARPGFRRVGPRRPSPGNSITIHGIGKQNAEALRWDWIGAEDLEIVTGIRGDEGAGPRPAFLDGGLVERTGSDTGAVLRLTGQVNQHVR